MNHDGGSYQELIKEYIKILYGIFDKELKKRSCSYFNKSFNFLKSINNNLHKFWYLQLHAYIDGSCYEGGRLLSSLPLYNILMIWIYVEFSKYQNINA